MRSLAALCLVALLSGSTPASQQSPAAPSWPQWGGPNRDFVVADAGPRGEVAGGGPPVLWSRPLGTGHSSIVVDDGRLFTMYRAGNGRAKLGPWEAEEVVVALDAKTGADDLGAHVPVAAAGFQLRRRPALDAARRRRSRVHDRHESAVVRVRQATGKVLWSHDFIKEFKSPELLIRPNVKTGYGCSPIAFRDTIICSVGGPGQSVMAFRQSDGAVVWKSGDFLTSAAAPILIDMAGQPQVVFLAGGTVTGLDPGERPILWSHPHDPGNDLNCSDADLSGPDNVLFVSSAYKAGSRAIS